MQTSRCVPRRCWLSLSVVACALFAGCQLIDEITGKDDDEKPASGTIAHEAPVQVATQVIEPGGGTMTIANPGGPLDGMTIDVSPDTYPNARTFTVSTSVITSHTLGPDFNPISPLITIKNGGGYSELPVKLRVPVVVPEGHFAMGFLYDDETGELEGLPLLESEPDHVTVFTRNFEHNLSSPGEPGVQGGALGFGQRAGALEDATAESKIVMSAAPRDALLGEIGTGFQVGVDDTPFVNNGSHPEPKGFCAGSVVASQWYFGERKVALGEEPFFTRFDGDEGLGPKDFWQDDVSGIKLASMLQSGYGMASFLDLVGILAQTTVKDDVTFAAFRYAMKLTGNPQMVSIHGGPGKGHAVNAYRIDGNIMQVADPNFPGVARTIEYDPALEQFKGYTASTRADFPGTIYRTVFYVGKKALVTWHRPSKHFAEVVAGTIGEGSFPKYTLKALDQNVESVPFVDGFKVYEKRLSIIVIEEGFDALWTAYDETGKALEKDNSFTSVQLTRSGVQWIGIEVSDTDAQWVGFDWVQVEALDNPAASCGGISCTDWCAGQSGMSGGFCLTDGTCECACDGSLASDEACRAYCGKPKARCGAINFPSCCSGAASDKHGCLCDCEACQ